MVSGGQAGGKSSGGSTGSGGKVGSGGSGGNGGSVGNGGSLGNGGSVGSGGSLGNGGSLGAAGSVGNGGSLGTGGSVGTSGGVSVSGGVSAGGCVGNGGSTGAGGSVGNGGNTGAGGATMGGSAGTGGKTTGTGGAVAGGTVAGGTAGTGTGGSSGTAGRTTGTGGATGTGGVAATGGTGGTSGGQPFKGIAGGACKVRTAMNVSWYYNWSPSENEACAAPNGVEYVPMIWGSGTAASIQTTVSGLASKGFKYVLGFNEPDNATQANITAAAAIALLPAFNNPALAVGTPATQANATGQAWFKEYMADVAANTTLRADFIAIHWYGWNAGSCDAAASQLESYINYAEGFPGNRPIWLTEWGCLNQSAPTAAGVITFFKSALAVFAKHPRVARYAWYQWSPNCEVYNTDDTLTDLGKVYAAAPSTK